MSDQYINIGSKVELLPTHEGVYQRAVAGSQGVIKAKKVDDDGFDMVYIEWDKDHWRYNGERDQWTYEGHFQAIDQMGVFAAMEDPQAFAERILESAKDRGGDNEEQIEEYIQKLDEVVNILAESEGFIILTARREASPTQPDSSVIIPYVYGAFMNSSIMLLIESQMVQLAAQANMEMAQKFYHKYRELEDGDDDSSLV